MASTMLETAPYQRKELRMNDDDVRGDSILILALLSIAAVAYAAVTAYCIAYPPV